MCSRSKRARTGVLRDANTSLEGMEEVAFFLYYCIIRLMARINIEFCHIYMNESFAEEHKASVLQYKDIASLLQKENKNEIVNMIMIDDYNTTDNFLDVDSMFAQIKEMGITPDFYVLESDFTKITESVFEVLGPRHEKQYRKYIEEKTIVPCSLLIVISYLFRLKLLNGCCHSMIHSLNGRPVSDFFSDRIVNILPRRFQGVEKQALEVIAASSPFNGISIEDKISEFFF